MQQHPTYEQLKTAAPDISVPSNNGGAEGMAGMTYSSSSSGAFIKVEQVVGVSDGSYQPLPNFPLNNSNNSNSPLMSVTHGIGLEAVAGGGNIHTTENGYPLPAQFQGIGTMESVTVKTEAMPPAAVLDAVGQQS